MKFLTMMQPLLCAMAMFLGSLGDLPYGANETAMTSLPLRSAALRSFKFTLPIVDDDVVVLHDESLVALKSNHLKSSCDQSLIACLRYQECFQSILKLMLRPYSLLIQILRLVFFLLLQDTDQNRRKNGMRMNMVLLTSKEKGEHKQQAQCPELRSPVNVVRRDDATFTARDVGKKEDDPIPILSSKFQDSADLVEPPVDLAEMLCCIPVLQVCKKRGRMEEAPVVLRRSERLRLLKSPTLATARQSQGLGALVPCGDSASQSPVATVGPCTIAPSQLHRRQREAEEGPVVLRRSKRLAALRVSSASALAVATAPCRRPR